MVARHYRSLGAELGEGITCFPDGQLWCVDIPAGAVYRVDPDGVSLEYRGESEISKVLAWEDGCVLMGRSGLIWCDAAFSPVGQLLINSPGSNLRLSDAVALPDGDVLVGVVDRDLAPHSGSLLYVSGDSVSEIVTGATISNGVAVCSDGHTVIWTDSATGWLEAFDWDSTNRTLTNRRPFAQIDPAHGVPDGICTDQEGGVWVAMWSGGKVLRLDQHGVLDQAFDIPVPHVTSVCFTESDDLIVTTAWATLDDAARAQCAQAGDLWLIPSSEHGCHRLPTAAVGFRPPPDHPESQEGENVAPRTMPPSQLRR